MTTVTREQLAALALQAIDDADARVVLADVIGEQGMPPGAMLLVQAIFGGRKKSALTVRKMLVREPAEHWRRAIAAVLLFGDWPTRWELAQRCQVDPLAFLREPGADAYVTVTGINREAGSVTVSQPHGGARMVSVQGPWRPTSFLGRYGRFGS